MSNMDDAHLQSLARLANIELSDDDRARLLDDVRAMAKMADSLRDVDMPASVEPLIDGGCGPAQAPREDVAGTPAGPSLLQGSGRFDVATGLLSVPRVVGVE
jgi:Asp-tRNA(Asn)/Glu-tRNA(Gln) amidotransferase C subunit